MLRWIVILGLIAAVSCISTPAFAVVNTTHGQKCDSDTTIIKKGQWRTIRCVNLCNLYAVADDNAECAEFDFTKGLPDILILEKEENDSNCSLDVTFTFTTGPVTGGTPSYALDTSAVVLNDATLRLSLIMKDSPLSNFLFVNVTNDDDCTDVDVRMYFITEY